jgi:SagB-type dehydrogenase family enzyme
MKRISLICIAWLTFLGVPLRAQQSRTVRLPDPQFKGKVSVEEALKQRRSIRTYASGQISLNDLSQILWAAQGVAEKIEKAPSSWRGSKWYGGLRTAPSAGALYPLEVYALVNSVSDLQPGTYRYDPAGHSLIKVTTDDKRSALYEAALRQESIKEGAAVLVVTGVLARTAVKYGERAQRYVYMEAGSVAQNIYLQSESLGLGTVLIGAFRDAGVKEALNLPAEEDPLIIMPIGKAR